MVVATPADKDDLSDIESDDDSDEEEKEPETETPVELPAQAPTDLNPETWNTAVRPGPGDVQENVTGESLVGQAELPVSGPVDVTGDATTSWQCLTNNIPSPNCPVFTSDSHLADPPAPPTCPACGSQNVLVVSNV